MTSMITNKPIAIPDVICDFGWRYGLQPLASRATIQLANLIANPSFEYDTVNTTPIGWSGIRSNSATLTTFQAQNGWALSGSQSARLTISCTSASGSYYYRTTPTGTSGIPIASSAKYTVLAQFNVLGLATGAAMDGWIYWYDSTGASLSQTQLTAGTGTGLHTLATVVTAPTNGAYASIQIGFEGNTATGTCDGYFDSLMFGAGDTAPTYADGDSPHWTWLGASGNSVSVDQKGGSFQTPLQQVVTFDAIDSQHLVMPKTITPPGVTIVDYHWDLGNGQIGRGPFVSTTYTYALPPPDLRASLTVTDSHNRTYSCAKPVNLQALTPLYGTTARERG